MEDYIRRVEYSYICKSCGEVHYEFSVPRYLTGIRAHQKLVDEIACTSCLEGPAVLASAKFHMSDRYGDNTMGLWLCPTLDNESVYYPVPMRQEFERILESIEPDSPITAEYHKILMTGFPWRCPFCRTPLHYRETRKPYQTASELIG